MSVAVPEPEIAFTRWFPWSIEENLQEYAFPGIYLLAHLDSIPSGTADPMDQRVIYIGETCGQTLGARLYQFDRSAFLGKFGHSGGLTYRSTFPDRGDALHFAMFPCNALPPDRSAYFIRYLERKLLWEFVKQWGHPPSCNSK